MKPKTAHSNKHYGDGAVIFTLKVMAMFSLIYVFRPLIQSFKFYLLILTPLISFICIRIRILISGEAFKSVLVDYITLIPYNYTEKEWAPDRNLRAIYFIILLNIAVFYWIPPTSIRLVLEALKEVSSNVHYQYFTDTLFQPLLSTFMHSDANHLWGNMIFLWIFGSVVERRIGWKRFLLIYLAAAWTCDLFSQFVYAHHQMPHGISIGASGAISGIMGVYMVRLHFKRMIFPLPLLGIFSSVLPLGLKVRIHSLFLISLYLANDVAGFYSQRGGTESNVDYAAHIGGLACGALLALLLKLQSEAYEENHLDKGLRMLGKNPFLADAESELRRVIHKNPRHVTALLTLAREQSRYRPTPKGYLYYQQALNVLADDNPAQAADVFVEYLQHYTHSLEPNLHYRLAGLLCRKGAEEKGHHALQLLLKNDTLPDDMRRRINNHLVHHAAGAYPTKGTLKRHVFTQ